MKITETVTFGIQYWPPTEARAGDCLAAEQDHGEFDH